MPILTRTEWYLKINEIIRHIEFRLFKIMFMYPIQIILRSIVHEHYNDAKDLNDVIISRAPP